jgi:hypothetical protein
LRRFDPTAVLGLVLVLILAGGPLAAPCATAASSAASSGSGAPPLSAAHARYVVLGQAPGGSTVALARLILDPGFGCPSIVPAGAPGGAAGGGGSSGPAAPIKMTPRDNPYHFPVVVCEAPVGFDEELAIAMDSGTLPLPVVRRDPRRIAVFGDTGCKLGAAAAGESCPAGTPAQPFADLAVAAAATEPDLVIHLGDYNYRGTPSKVLFTERDGASAKQVGQWTYDAGDGTEESEQCVQTAGAGFFYSQSAANAGFPDSWEAWNDDLFSTAPDLLAAAPWVVARGNHELCSKAGPGWFYFLDPHSDLITGDRQLSCPPPDPAKAPIDNVVLSPPYAVGLGSLTLLVVDSANACDSFTEETFTAAYAGQLAEVGRLVPSEGTAWWVSHRPLWGVTGFYSGESTGCAGSPRGAVPAPLPAGVNPAGPLPRVGGLPAAAHAPLGRASSAAVAGSLTGSEADRYGCINQTLQAALGSGLGGALPAAVELVLAGHMHRFQAVTFEPGGGAAGARPPVVVVGTGGVALDPSPPVGAFATMVGGLPAQVLTTGAEVGTPDGAKAAFGYLDLTFGGASGTWSGRLVDPSEGLTIATCGPPGEDGRNQVCALAPGVTAE